MLGSLSVHLSEDAKAWAEKASAKDIALAVEFGYHAVKHMSAGIVQTQVETPEVLQPTNTRLGQIGEAHIEKILRAKYPNVTNTAQTSKSGDLSLYIEHSKIIIEVKNYRNPVPTLSVEKFQRDIETANAAGGVFISMQSPIAAITDTFELKFETSYNGTPIPCAYVVSSDENTIITAVNIIARLISATKYLTAELYNRDKIANCINSISSALDGVSKSRNDLHGACGDLVSKLLKISSGIAVAESDLRGEISACREELYHSECANTQYQLEQCYQYNRQSGATKQHINDIIAIISQDDISNIAPSTSSTWKLSNTRFIHSSGVGFQLYATRVDVIIPRRAVLGIVPDPLTSGLQMTFDRAGNITVGLDAMSVDLIKKMLLGDGAPINNTADSIDEFLDMM